MWWSIYHLGSNFKVILNLESEFQISVCVLYYSHITVGKTWFSHSRCSNRYKCKYYWYPLVLYVWIIFQKRLWHILVWLLWYNQIKHFLPFPLLYVHPIDNLWAQAFNTLHSMYKVWIKRNYREILGIDQRAYKMVFKSVVECVTCKYHSIKPFYHYCVCLLINTQNFSVIPHWETATGWNLTWEFNL